LEDDGSTIGGDGGCIDSDDIRLLLLLLFSFITEELIGLVFEILLRIVGRIIPFCDVDGIRRLSFTFEEEDGGGKRVERNEELLLS
jgi:hypothetical protein